MTDIGRYCQERVKGLHGVVLWHYLFVCLFFIRRKYVRREGGKLKVTQRVYCKIKYYSFSINVHVYVVVYKMNFRPK